MKQTNFAKTLTRYFAVFLPSHRNLSTNTIKSYRDVFKQFLIYLRDEQKIKPEFITFADVSSDKVKGFLMWLEKTKKVSINTRNQRLAAIHSFFRYAQTEHPEILSESQRILGIPFKRKQQTIISYLTKDALKLILNQPDLKTKRGRRDLALMTTLYDTGSRVQELISLKAKDVRLAKPATITLLGKGNKKRAVPLMEKTRNILRTYMEESHLLDNGRQHSSLFFNSRKQEFTRPGIAYILNKYLQIAKNNHPEVIFPESINPHMFRHTKALHLLESGVNLIYIRDLLGHVSVTTTEIYLRADTELKRAALESVYPDVVTQDIPEWMENTEILNWLERFCR